MLPTLTGIRFCKPSQYSLGAIQLDWSNDRHERGSFDSLTYEDVVVGIVDLLNVLIRDKEHLDGGLE